MSTDTKDAIAGAALVILLFAVMWICFAAFPDGFYR